jgi:hypothetical protein
MSGNTRVIVTLWEPNGVFMQSLFLHPLQYLSFASQILVLLTFFKDVSKTEHIYGGGDCLGQRRLRHSERALPFSLNRPWWFRT